MVSNDSWKLFCSQKCRDGVGRELLFEVAGKRITAVSELQISITKGRVATKAVVAWFALVIELEIICIHPRVSSVVV